MTVEQTLENYDYFDSMRMLRDNLEYWRISGRFVRYGMPHPISPTGMHDADEAEIFRYQAQAIAWASRDPDQEKDAVAVE